MKRMYTVLFVFMITACTFQITKITPSMAVATRSVPTIVPASATPIPFTATTIPPTATAIPSPTQTQVNASYPWWNDTVFYELSVPSFYDSNHAPFITQ
jgi:hypothetical protein